MLFRFVNVMLLCYSVL